MKEDGFVWRKERRVSGGKDAEKSKFVYMIATSRTEKLLMFRGELII